ncbi:hypothetical protein J8273_3417 [Carpediemonas membranifera]|uniref:Uncharacterized protein n=1 Tax=Carpediemonas membranifera TaxID=201153 RepID=A0A8J6B581_9EUKA|nr:hypothetical protein J8273_3417 [Carpediemonas membranifera]|eukprot:KAG9393284.1 hypothetical protein J8273_3417 [Carpediemonas membranifera]
MRPWLYSTGIQVTESYQTGARGALPGAAGHPESSEEDNEMNQAFAIGEDDSDTETESIEEMPIVQPEAPVEAPVDETKKDEPQPAKPTLVFTAGEDESSSEDEEPPVKPTLAFTAGEDDETSSEEEDAPTPAPAAPQKPALAFTAGEDDSSEESSDDEPIVEIPVTHTSSTMPKPAPVRRAGPHRPTEKCIERMVDTHKASLDEATNLLAVSAAQVLTVVQDVDRGYKTAKSNIRQTVQQLHKLYLHQSQFSGGQV